MFETLNKFKLKSCQLQSFITFRDLQLSFCKFLHPRSFTKFEVHFAVCQIWGTRQSICRVPWSSTPQNYFFLFFVSFFFCSFCFLFLFFQIDYHTLWIYLIKFSQLCVLNFSTHIIALFYGVIDQNSIYVNSIIVFDILKLSNGSKKLSQFYMKQYILPIGYKIFFEVKLKFDRHFHSKPNRILLNSLILLRRCFHLKASYVTKLQNPLKFLPQAPHMISWDIDKSHNFQTSIDFFRILKSFEHTFVVVFPRQDVCNFFSFDR